MKKTALFVMILLFAVNGIFAWPNGNWVYAIPGLDAKMKFWVSGGIDLTSGEITIRQA
jgi:hypothetical protein